MADLKRLEINFIRKNRKPRGDGGGWAAAKAGREGCARRRNTSRRNRRRETSSRKRSRRTNVRGEAIRRKRRENERGPPVMQVLL